MVDIKLMKKKFTYISNSKIPSMEANSVHVVNMANAFSVLKILVDFFAYKGFLKKSIKKFYGLKNNLKISFFFLSPAPIFNSIEIIITSFRLKKNTIILYDFFTFLNFRRKGYYTKILKLIKNIRTTKTFIIYSLKTNKKSCNGILKSNFILKNKMKRLF